MQSKAFFLCLKGGDALDFAELVRRAETNKVAHFKKVIEENERKIKEKRDTMRLFDKPVVLLTHTDLDGVGSPVVLKYIFKQTEDELLYIHYTNNGKVESTIESIIEKRGTDGYKLFICDHSPVREMYDKMVELNMDFHIFDHHKSSQVAGLPHVTLDIEQCATQLFFNYLISEVIGEASWFSATVKTHLGKFVYHVNDYDMWHHESPHTKRLNELLYEVGITDFVNRFAVTPHPVFTEGEELVVSIAEKKREKYIERAIDSAVLHTDHDKKRFAVIFAESHQSELGNQANEKLETDYVFMVNAQSCKVSLRGKDTVDVSLIAKHFSDILETNSGGHKAAAGFGFNPEQLPKLYHLLETY